MSQLLFIVRILNYGQNIADTKKASHQLAQS